MSKVDTEDTRLQGSKRPYVPSEAARRVEQYASKHGLADREAYAEVIEMTLDEEGGVKR